MTVITSITTWWLMIQEEMMLHNETWDDAISCTLGPDEIDRPFDRGWGGINGPPFTVWTRTRVYFPATHNGAEWCASVARHPDGQPTEHIGG